jgi:hypothetical protein
VRRNAGIAYSNLIVVPTRYMHHATQGDPLGIKPFLESARQKGIMGLLLDILQHEPENAVVLRRWGGP